MGKPTGFMEYKREDAPAFSVKERIKNYNEFHTPLSQELRRALLPVGYETLRYGFGLSAEQPYSRMERPYF